MINAYSTTIEHDMRDLADLPGSYDAVAILWQSFGYFDEATNRAILGQINRKLNPQGRLILDIYHRGFFERHQGERHFEKDGLMIAETKRMSGNRLTVELQYGPAQGRDTFTWQLYTPEEIRDLAGAYGFACLIVCSGFDEHVAASADQPRMQMVFEKG